MSDLLATIGDGFWNAFLMAYEVWWALVLGFLISAIVQAWIPRESVERRLSGDGPRPVVWSTALGAASSSCSYAAVAIAKSLFQKGASAVSALAFQFASTNLVWELGLVLWVLIGWQFTLAQYVGGLIMIVIMAAGLRLFVSPRLEAQAREHAQRADTGHQHHMAGSSGGWRERLTSPAAWSDVAHNFRGDWQMLWKEIGAGFLVAGFVALLDPEVFSTLFVSDAPPLVRTLENVVAGPLIAVVSFVCSIGNVPLAAVLWANGISFAGVMAFIFADLIVLPILAVYRKYYGWAFAARISVLMLGAMILAALAVDGLFSIAGLIPQQRPTTEDVFGSLDVDYKLVLNAVATFVFAGLVALTVRRGVRDPVCGMTVDRARAVREPAAGSAILFCSEDCRSRYREERASRGVSSEFGAGGGRPDEGTSDGSHKPGERQPAGFGGSAPSQRRT
ncbi:MAG: permease [Candidatus Limnocylindria bacterium]